MYIDEHVGHGHDTEQKDHYKGVEQENLIFEDINQTVIKVKGATLHISQNITCKFYSPNQCYS